MNIKNCIDQALETKQVLNEAYIMKIVAFGKTEYVVPVDVKVKSVSLPMQQSDVDFTYESTIQNDQHSAGQYKFDIYYPVGSDITVGGKTMTIERYDEPTKNIFGNNLYYVTAYANYVDFVPMNQRITNDAIEMEILGAMNQIICANDSIKRNLRNYDTNLLPLIGSDPVAILKATEIISEIRQWDTHIIRGFSNKLKASYVGNDPSSMERDITALIDYNDSEYITLGFFNERGYSEAISAQAFVSWLAHKQQMMNDAGEGNIDLGNLRLIADNASDIRLRFLSTETEGCLYITVYIPSPCTYNIVFAVNSWNALDQFGQVSPDVRVIFLDKDTSAPMRVACYKLNMDIADDGLDHNVSWEAFARSFALICDTTLWTNNLNNLQDLLTGDVVIDEDEDIKASWIPVEDGTNSLGELTIQISPEAVPVALTI